MKKNVVIFSAIGALIFITLCSYSGGTAINGVDCTGAESASIMDPNPTGCSDSGMSCHATTPTTSLSVNIELDSFGVPTTHYVGGNTYIVKITCTNGSPFTLPKAGFQLAALKDTVSHTSNHNAGIWSATGLPPSTQLVLPSPSTQLTIMEQDSSINVTGGTFTRSFVWNAPLVGTGSISFWGAVCFINGDTVEDTADHWNTNHVVITEIAAPTSVSAASNTSEITAFPNPANDYCNIQWLNATPGAYNIQVMNLNGTALTASQIEVNTSSHSERLDTKNWVPGLYNVVIQKDNFSKSLIIVRQ